MIVGSTWNANSTRVLRTFLAERGGHDARPDRLVAERAEHEPGPDAAEIQQPVDAAAGGREGLRPAWCATR